MINPADVIDTPRAMRILGLYGEIEWGRFAIGLNPVDSKMFPSSLVWRYRDPSGNVAEVFKGVVLRLSGVFEWRFDCSGKNWTLIPARLANVIQGPPRVSLSDALGELMAADPGFCVRSNAELGRLLSAIENEAERTD